MRFCPPLFRVDSPETTVSDQKNKNKSVGLFKSLVHNSQGENNFKQNKK